MRAHVNHDKITFAKSFSCIVIALSLIIIMQIWYMEPYPFGDRRMPHHVFPPKTLGVDVLQSITGVTHFKVG